MCMLQKVTVEVFDCICGADEPPDFCSDESREVRYDARKCGSYFDAMKAEGKMAVCGMCLYICPHGRKFL